MGLALFHPHTRFTVPVKVLMDTGSDVACLVPPHLAHFVTEVAGLAERHAGMVIKAANGELITPGLFGSMDLKHIATDTTRRTIAVVISGINHIILGHPWMRSLASEAEIKSPPTDEIRMDHITGNWTISGHVFEAASPPAAPIPMERVPASTQQTPPTGLPEEPKQQLASAWSTREKPTIPDNNMSYVAPVVDEKQRVAHVHQVTTSGRTTTLPEQVVQRKPDPGKKT
jgi:hypothetical protein